MPTIGRHSSPVLFGAGRLSVMHQVILTSSIGLLSTAVAPGNALAQEASRAPDHVSRWGVAGSFTPTWRVPDAMARIVAPDEKVDINAREFSIGFVRGSIAGGDWGVAFARKKFLKGSTSSQVGQICTGSTQAPPCFPTSTTEKYDDASFPGVEFHWFVPFATVRHRVQIGLNLAGGLARPSGTVTRISDSFKVVSFNPVTAVPVHTEESPNMSSDWAPVFPILKAEAQAAVILGPAFKLKLGGGLNVPGIGFDLKGVYLFGAHRMP